MNTKQSLSNLKDLKPSKTAVAKRAQSAEVIWRSGEELIAQNNRLVIGIRGDSGSGKTVSVFHMMEHTIELAAEDDDHIRDVFSFDKELMNNLLNTSIPKRRAELEKAHMFVFIDFDNRGAEAHFKAENCNPRLFDRVKYTGTSTWEESYKALNEGLDALKEHAKKWGTRGCYMIVDNMDKAWAAAQSDYTMAQFGIDNNTLLAETRMNNPGQSSEARRAQSKEVAKSKDWTVINGAFHAEWLDKMANSDYNVLFLSPNKTRPREVKVGNEMIKEDAPGMGGSKHVVFACDYVINKFKDEDGNFWAIIEKTRSFEIAADVQPTKLANPRWSRIIGEIKELDAKHLKKKRALYAKREYYDGDDFPPKEAVPKPSKLKNMLANIALDMPVPSKPKKKSLLDLESVGKKDVDFNITTEEIKESIEILATPSFDLDLGFSLDPPKEEPELIFGLPADEVTDDDVVKGHQDDEYRDTGECRSCSVLKDNLSTDHPTCYECDRPKYLIHKERKGKYHDASQNCSLGKKMAEHNRLISSNVEGMKPCSRCVKHEYKKDAAPAAKPSPLDGMPQWGE